MGKVQFDINPHVIRQLGAELVSDNVTAFTSVHENYLTHPIAYNL